MATTPSVGFIGIGTMGWPMAANIHKAGLPLRVHDSDEARMRRFCEEHVGAKGGSLGEVAGQEVVVTMLPTGRIVREVLTEAAGGEFARHVRPGTLVIDMSSSEPTGSRHLADWLAARGVVFVDAPVSGAEPRARAGTLTIMIGCDESSVLPKARQVLATMGNRLFETGGCGSGHACKALNNLLGATAFAATSEAVLIAERFGLDPAVLVDILNVSTGKSFISEVVMKEHVLERKYATGFKMGLMAKDVQIAADLAAAVGLAAPVTQLVNQRWQQALEQQGFDADNTEAIKFWQR
ncbi:MAG: NAD(P)-dependent oxidoreductase [Pseudohongiellaceae bacterium]|jgi:3-hydroxyisobutyrate dehydrogenase